MANDREVLRLIWEGRLPVCFQLNSDEVYDIQAPDPFYLMVPRLSYFPLVTDKIRKHFVRHIHPDKQEAEMWLDFNGMALKWHYPIGVLFDMYAADIQLPWNITVHFDKFPEDELLHCPSREAVESHFMSCVKEADVLKHRSQVMSNMQKKDHIQLWLGLQNGSVPSLWCIIYYFGIILKCIISKVNRMLSQYFYPDERMREDSSPSLVLKYANYIIS
ncbi:autophagy protein 5 isoform X2 [Anabrus simplex]|uniref:autophagy protein 5 isoform X2 n=1 Tax=Anabrus simplex TaxID=316456 RepID=UPI0035A2FFE8